MSTVRECREARLKARRDDDVSGHAFSVGRVCIFCTVSRIFCTRRRPTGRSGRDHSARACTSRVCEEETAERSDDVGNQSDRDLPHRRSSSRQSRQYWTSAGHFWPIETEPKYRAVKAGASALRTCSRECPLLVPVGSLPFIHPIHPSFWHHGGCPRGQRPRKGDSRSCWICTRY